MGLVKLENRDIKNTIRDAIPSALEIAHVGSRVTCNPAPTDTDNDFLVFISGNFSDAEDKKLKDSGFVLGGSVFRSDIKNTTGNYEYFFWSYTKGDLNIIVIDSYEFYTKFLYATELSKNLNLLNKGDRIALFQYVLYGNTVKATNEVNYVSSIK